MATRRYTAEQEASEVRKRFEQLGLGPTPEAYAAACKALENHRQRADQAEAERDGIRRLHAALLKTFADAERRAARLEEALLKVAIQYVTSGANPRPDGTFAPPLWHGHCLLCDHRWSVVQKKRPEVLHPAHTNPFNEQCLLALSPEAEAIPHE